MYVLVCKQTKYLTDCMFIFFVFVWLVFLYVDEQLITIICTISIGHQFIVFFVNFL